ncbi:MAG: flagellar basal body-associated FliL family protein [Methylobacter tundripaludum]|uniref:Flagellar protein FliL n=1 Tax=Methylobacter tundripaludum TaxID=173365 RepID=A0A2S6GNX2_9GAMM|nr:flagellar basal body-associated FliL family protein [Methylobacter tundripaludum]MCK9637317.1 flagellar basal body-associated FliL family protein [Methylobacter tundripaludum]PPK66934.1 flagellar FliL protein [Methylobacter tundripaludum]
MRLLVMLLSLLFISVAAANEGAKESEAEAGVKYIEMTPKFTVNLAEPKKFLLVNVQLLVEGAGTIAAVKKHMPALRHALIMLYSGRPSEELQTMEQREALRKETAAVIRQTLEKSEDGKGHSASAEEGRSEEGAGHPEGFKDAYFTEFLID